jgi:hypothetical protein
MQRVSDDEANVLLQPMRLFVNEIAGIENPVAVENPVHDVFGDPMPMPINEGNIVLKLLLVFA